MSAFRILLVGLLAGALWACQGQTPTESTTTQPALANSESAPETENPAEQPMAQEQAGTPANLETATFGAGCYWCVEAVLEQVDGVQSVVSGFMGGSSNDVTYEEVCTGRTGHAEVVQVRFDPNVVSYETLLDWFWRLHDPTTLNRQGADVGTQYRSAIFTHSDAQRMAAEKSKAEAAPAFADPIVTEITPASELITAPDKHQDYYRENRQAGYCRVVIAPKLRKLGLQD